MSKPCPVHRSQRLGLHRKKQKPDSYPPSFDPPRKSRWKLLFDRIKFPAKNEFELEMEDLGCVLKLIPERERDMLGAQEALEKMDRKLEPGERFQLAATDLFVEKAQLVLTRRSVKMFRYGIATIFFTFIILLATGWIVYRQMDKPVSDQVMNSTQALVLRILQATALSAFVLVGIKYLVSLGRCFFHEGVALLHRRHALRYGRLFVYMRKGNVNAEELADAFQWNKEFSTSFLDIKPELVAETLLHKLVDGIAKLPPKALENFTKLAGVWLGTPISRKEGSKGAPGCGVCGRS